MTRIAILQMQSGIDPAENAAVMVAAVADAARGGATMLFTPEMSGLLDRDRSRASAHIVVEADDRVLAAMRAAAVDHGIWVAIGSLAVLAHGQQQAERARWANRSFVIDPAGEIVARYDKMHMFDVSLDDGESWSESSAYAPGERITTVDTPAGRLGLSICYDIRFPALYQRLGMESCDIIAIPAAFTAPTGRDHWHVLQRARAIEQSSYVVAAAQVGKHDDGRTTYGHSLVIDPWGKVLLDMGGDRPALGFVEIEQERIASARRQVPSLANRRDIAATFGT
ncbi:N-carbamoyl-D-amino-acid hydrolase [Alteripontixanthobacter maritimus]|uniref:N-carbamoyl-D-amino-acid hydrolase n=1 Tax=Alteripontixanthobacter maritimus TaxID=2161824 RepID=A0A369Q6G4_9SPHN|nr:carbon-nitrogen hydrolase family protein [Alteripontixanthobacter maritimus]RDC60010.1 N-carbamoyl-D-amino-acid hydrolase [Alteripontixanthobacter maritimus]